MLAYGIEVSFESLLQCIHVWRPASAMAGTCGGPVFCVCWHGRGIKDREVNGMKHRILTVCLLLALLLQDLQHIGTIIGIAGGKSKAAAILSVIRASRQDILITDEAAAHEILKMAKEQ